MDEMQPKATKRRKSSLHFYLVIFFVGILFTVTLWDAYYGVFQSGERPFHQDAGSVLILLMGTLFSVSASLFSWSLETRKGALEKEVKSRTHDLNEKNKELAKKNEEVENFIHIISHDLKAPIVSIQGFAAILKTELKNNLQGASLDYFNRIQANAQQMTVLINDLLEFSRVGRLEDEKETVDSGALIREVLDELKPELDKRHIRVELPKEFPVLWGSKKRLSQVFTNLIGNAVKYIGSPGDPRIEIGCADANGQINACAFWVKDNGIGIKKEFQDKIFQIFQRAPNHLKVEGSGIGLSIVKKIVELNGGRVWVESEEGKGSQFFVEWPKANDRLKFKPSVAA